MRLPGALFIRQLLITSAGFILLSVTPGLSVIRAQEPSQTQQKLSVEEARKTYDDLVARVKKNDKTVDFIELISAASDLDLARPGIFTPPGRDDMVTAFKAKDYKRATELAETVLDFEFTNRGLHRSTENAYRELGNREKAEFHAFVSDQILKALLKTGDGKTIETAYCVQGINEEYLIMRQFGYEVSSQALIMSGQSSYDYLTGTDKNSKKEVGLYFDISGHFRRCVKSHVKN